MWPWYIGLDSKSGLSCKNIFPPRLQQFQPECRTPLRKSFEEIFPDEISYSFIWTVLWTFIHFAPHLSLTLLFHHSFAFYFLSSVSHHHHTTPIPLALTALSSLSFSSPSTYPFLCLPVHVYPYFEPHPKGCSCPVWLRTGHSLFFFLQRLWLDPFFFFFLFHPLQLLCLIERPLWLNFLISHPVE